MENSLEFYEFAVTVQPSVEFYTMQLGIGYSYVLSSYFPSSIFLKKILYKLDLAEFSLNHILSYEITQLFGFFDMKQRGF